MDSSEGKTHRNEFPQILLLRIVGYDQINKNIHAENRTHNEKIHCVEIIASSAGYQTNKLQFVFFFIEI